MADTDLTITASVEIDTNSAKTKESFSKAGKEFADSLDIKFNDFIRSRITRATAASANKKLDPIMKSFRQRLEPLLNETISQNQYGKAINEAIKQQETKDKVLKNLNLFGAGTPSQSKKRMKAFSHLDALSASLTGTFSEEQFRKGKIREAIIASNLRAINPATGKILSGITGDLSHLGPTDNQELKDMSSFYKNQAIRSAVIQSNLSAINPATGKVLSGLTGDLSYLGPTNNKELKDMNAFYKNEAIRSAIIQSNLKAVNPATGKVLSGITGDLSHLGPTDNEQLKKINDFYFKQEYRDVIAGQYKQIKPTSKLTQALKSQADLENKIKTGKIPVSLGEIFSHAYDKDFLKKQDNKKNELMKEGFKKEEKEKQKHNEKLNKEAIKTIKKIGKYAIGAAAFGMYGFHKINNWASNATQDVNRYENYQTMYGASYQKLQSYEKLFYKYGNISKDETQKMFGHFADMYTRAKIMPTNSPQLQKLFGMLRISELPASEFDLFNKVMKRAFSGQLTREEASLLTRDFGIPAGVMNTLEKMRKIPKSEMQSIINTNITNEEGSSLVRLGEAMRGLKLTWEDFKGTFTSEASNFLLDIYKGVDDMLKKKINDLRQSKSTGIWESIKREFWADIIPLISGGLMGYGVFRANPTAFGAGLSTLIGSELITQTPKMFEREFQRINDEKIIEQLKKEQEQGQNISFNISIDKVSARDVAEARDIGNEFGSAVFNSAMNEMKKSVLYQRGSMNFSV